MMNSQTNWAEERGKNPFSGKKRSLLDSRQEMGRLGENRAIKRQKMLEPGVFFAC